MRHMRINFYQNKANDCLIHMVVQSVWSLAIFGPTRVFVVRIICFISSCKQFYHTSICFLFLLVLKCNCKSPLLINVSCVESLVYPHSTFQSAEKSLPRQVETAFPSLGLIAVYLLGALMHWQSMVT